jgi:hypothetical protein
MHAHERLEWLEEGGSASPAAPDVSGNDMDEE